MTVKSSARYDFVVVGGGSAGSVLASRLSADPANHVLVLEAGRPDYKLDPFIHVPSAYMFPLGNRFYDWCYETEPEPFMNDRRIYHARGKVLGGSSSINGMVFQRSNPMTYDTWAALPGLEEWSYAHCLPYFKRMETRLEGANEYRGDSGPLTISRGAATSPLFKAFLDATREAGYPSTDDVNGYQQEGFGRFDANIANGRRMSAADAYLHPAANRPNLKVKCRALVTRILFEGQRAIGVEYRHGRAVHRAYAGEVILCGGAFNTPQVLQISGVGNATDLEATGVTVMHDLPGVGENLQDHLEVYVPHACKQPVSMAPALKWRNRPRIALEWILTHKGIAATNHAEAGGFARSNDEVAYPNLMFHFIPIAIRYDGTQPAPSHGYQVHVGPMYSADRGSVRITSSDPAVHPAVQFNYLSTGESRREWVEALQVTRRILSQPAFAPFDAGELSPGGQITSDDDILEWVANDAETALHPSCSCKMGTGPESVIDPHTMAVHGLEGLRIVDASVMPVIPNSNIYAPVIMIAEKSADIILGDTPLAPTPVEYYRHLDQTPEQVA